MEYRGVRDRLEGRRGRRAAVADNTLHHHPVGEAEIVWKARDVY